MSIAIQAQNIGKQYRLGEVGTGTISHDLNRLWAKMRGKPDPFLKIGESNDRSTKSSSDYVWALRDINFDIQQGDAVGIIGRNGAGKSTLLKILSRTTSPTTGSVKVRGRIASLLEVGTGFQPELTGRENIYQNGAILGMRKAEITRKMDEIIDFSGCERYIDTPVKRYSSGMYVRLAFAVAAHLESEILVVDEVLAVGDAEFQKKCLGKMGDISRGEGRTVLFVSHNMEALQNLCDKAILLKEGKVVSQGTAIETVSNYLKNFVKEDKCLIWDLKNAKGNDIIKWLKISVGVIDNVNNTPFYTNDELVFEFEFQLNSIQFKNFDITYHLVDERGILVYVGSSGFNYDFSVKIGLNKIVAKIPPNILNYGTYTITKLLAVIDKGSVLHHIVDTISFELLPEPKESSYGWMGAKEGVIYLPKTEWYHTSI
jgi:lipopolysaccharide transport system ATP-binding protein